MKNRKLVLNTYVALIYQVVTIICGLIVPRVIIATFGSRINGLVSSINQFLTIITLCECGVGAVVQSALYKPLADNDTVMLSKIMKSSNRFFNNIMKILAAYVVGLFFIYPFLVNQYEFDYLYIASLVVVLALSYMAQYYLFLPYRLLLNADQLSYIQLSIHTGVLILNTISTVVLVKLGCSIHIVKLASACCFLLQPILLKLIVEKKYTIIKDISYDAEPIKQKWNGLAQHIASVVLDNTDSVVLTIFSTLENVSMYGVYFLVAHGIRQVIRSFGTGIQSFFGNLYAKDDIDQLNRSFNKVESVFHWIITFLYSVAAILIIPFVKIYTVSFTDVDYIFPLFGYLLLAAQAIYCLRIPYEAMVRAAGHFKETQKSSIIEAVINISVSITLVLILPESYELIGVAIGTICAMSYRTIYLVLYLRKNILKRKAKRFVISVVLDILIIFSTIWMMLCIPQDIDDYFKWIILAIIVTIIAFVVSFGMNFLVKKKDFISSLKLFMGR